MYEIETGEDGEPLHDEDGQPVYRTDENGEQIPIYVTDENGDPVQAAETVNPPNIAAPAGQISMIAAGSESEVDIANPVSEIGSPKSDITLSDRAKIDVSGSGAGSVFIRSGRLFADDSTIQAKTLGDRDGGRVDIQADELSFTRGANINGSVEGTGRGADVDIRADGSVSFSGEDNEAEASRIRLRTGYENKDAGDAGRLEIEARNISFADGARIDSATWEKGRGGDVILSASDSVSFAGEKSDGWGSGISVGTIYGEDGAGDAGRLEIQARNISFADGASVNSGNWGKGKGGEVILSASDSVSFAGEKSDGWGSRIVVTTQYMEDGAGDAGRLEIEARNISFADGASVDSATNGKGKGGEVILSASDSVSFADGAWIYSTTHGKGKGGEVILSASDSVSFAGSRRTGRSGPGPRRQCISGGFRPTYSPGPGRMRIPSSAR